MVRRASPRRYAQAVFELSLEQDRLDSWADDLQQIEAALAVEDFKAFLQHAKISLDRKVQVINEVLAEVSPLAQNLLSLLVSRGLVGLVPRVKEEYLQLVDRYRGRERVEIRSAVPLVAQESQRIGNLLQAMLDKEVVLDAKVDPSILGGLMLRIGDKLLDGSIRARLEGLKKELNRAAIQPRS